MNDNFDIQQLGELVHHTRLRRGWTLMQLATAAGVDESWVSRLERGEYGSPDPRGLVGVARALEVDARDLFILAGYDPGEDLPGLVPYLRSKYDLPPEAVAQLEAHFELINDKYRRDQEEGGPNGDHHRAA